MVSRCLLQFFGPGGHLIELPAGSARQGDELYMEENNRSGRFFAVTNPGLSATRWLAFVLAANKDVFVAHGKHALDSVLHGDFQREKTAATVDSLARGNDRRAFYESRSLEDVLMQYQQIMPQARAHGCVHSYTIHTLALAAECPETLAQIHVRNVVRHPVPYLSSHHALVRAAEKYPSLYQHYVENDFPDALQQFPELFLLPCPDYRDFLAFAVSCLSVANLLLDLSYPGFQHVQMETLTTQADTLTEFCQDLTGLRYEPAVLDNFIRQGAINQHRPGASRQDPHETYTGWQRWQQDMAHLMIPATVLDWLEGIGYDLSMFREKYHGGAAAATQSPVPSLGDYLRAIDQRHPLLTFQSQTAPSRIQTLDTKYQGFDLKHVGGNLYAVACTRKIDDLSQVDDKTLRQLHEERLCLLGGSLAEIWQIIAWMFSSRPKLVEEYRGFNLVAYRDKFYAFSFTQGVMDLDRFQPRDWKELEISAKKIGRHEWHGIFVGCSLQEVKDQVDAQAAQENLINGPEPHLVEAAYRGYNLVLWRSDYYGMYQGLGPVDLATAAKTLLADAIKRKEIVLGKSLADVKEKVDRLHRGARQRRSAEALGTRDPRRASTAATISC